MDKPAIYRIKVKGVLPESWFERLGGLQITANASEGMTLIEGWLPDQSALAGVLDTLFTLHFPIVEVSCLQNGSCSMEGSDRPLFLMNNLKKGGS